MAPMKTDLDLDLVLVLDGPGPGPGRTWSWTWTWSWTSTWTSSWTWTWTWTWSWTWSFLLLLFLLRSSSLLLFLGLCTQTPAASHEGASRPTEQRRAREGEPCDLCTKPRAKPTTNYHKSYRNTSNSIESGPNFASSRAPAARAGLLF